jgi:chromosome segregation ATPase
MGAGGNNILDKNAMEQIAEMAKALPEMRLDITREIHGVRDEVSEVSERVTTVEGKLDSLRSDVESEPLRCQYRETISSSEKGVGRLDGEVKDLKDEQVAQGKDLESVKTRMNVFTGINAAYTTILTALAKNIGSLLQGGS